MKAFFYSKGHALWPDDDEAAKIVQSMGDGVICEVEVKRPRSIVLLRKYWRLCEYVAEACPGVETKENVDHILKLQTGNVHIFKVGETLHQRPGSISFAQMDADEFDLYYRRCVKVILELFLPNMTEKSIVEELERMMGLRY